MLEKREDGRWGGKREQKLPSNEETIAQKHHQMRHPTQEAQRSFINYYHLLLRTHQGLEGYQSICRAGAKVSQSR